MTTTLPTPFDAYEIHGVKQFYTGGDLWFEQVDDEEADFWSLYGHILGEGLQCIGDFSERALAEQVYSRITGELYQTGRRDDQGDHDHPLPFRPVSGSVAPTSSD